MNLERLQKLLLIIEIREQELERRLKELEDHAKIIEKQLKAS